MYYEKRWLRVTIQNNNGTYARRRVIEWRCQKIFSFGFEFFTKLDPLVNLGFYEKSMYTK